MRAFYNAISVGLATDNSPREAHGLTGQTPHERRSEAGAGHALALDVAGVPRADRAVLNGVLLVYRRCFQ